ncbi:MAG: hypothetical protein IT548_18540 [Alphaproteobacteria bacterium]|nr:hypothetical protein [Alphaproteobacteria bacterium]
MGFSVTKAAIYGLAVFVGLLAGLYVTGGLGSLAATIAFSAVAALVLAIAFGFMMRPARLEMAAATPESVAAAIRNAWALRSFKAREVGAGVMRYSRGVGPFGDSFTVTPTATGVTLEGPYNIIRVVKNKAAG